MNRKYGVLYLLGTLKLIQLRSITPNHCKILINKHKEPLEKSCMNNKENNKDYQLPMKKKNIKL